MKKEKTHEKTKEKTSNSLQKGKMNNKKNVFSNICHVFGFTRNILDDFVGLSLLLKKCSTKTSTISLIFFKHDSFSKRNQQPNWVSPFFKGKVTFLGQIKKTHILRVNIGELSVFVDTGTGVLFVVLCCCRDPGDCLLPVLVWSLRLLLSKEFWAGMVCDGF